MKQPLRTLAAATATTTALLALTTSPALASQHHGQNWSWAGPASWTASYGTYGITISGSGGAVLDLGFSSIVCSSGATYDTSVTNYFAAQRKKLKQNGWTLSAGAIGHPSGFSKQYRRQLLSGTNGTGAKKVRGQIVLDYDFSSSVDGVNYCYQRSLAKYAKDKQWADLKKTLQSVQSSLAYSGPGAPEGEDPGA